MKKPVPATAMETAEAFDVIRAAAVTLVAGRASKSITITERQRRKAYGKVLRVSLDADLTIRLWLEDYKPNRAHRPGTTWVESKP